MGEEMCAYLDGFGVKTFVYKYNESFYVVNGVPEKTKDGVIIRSYAPFPKEFHYLQKDQHFICKNGETLDKILLTKNGFKRI